MLLSGFNQEIYEKGLREEGWEAGIEEGREEGHREGIKEGVEQGKAEEKEHAIINMLDLGLSKEMIAKKYPMELIEKVLKSCDCK
jgi:flagellar biosynthesis/type III secretory pathway protein FliH